MLGRKRACLRQMQGAGGNSESEKDAFTKRMEWECSYHRGVIEMEDGSFLFPQAALTAQEEDNNAS